MVFCIRFMAVEDFQSIKIGICNLFFINMLSIFYVFKLKENGLPVN